MSDDREAFNHDGGKTSPSGHDGAGGIDVSLTLPFYHPGPLFRPTLERTIEVLESSSLSYELLAVSDGSDESSVSQIADLVSPTFRIIRLASNQGKGAAVRRGLALSKGRYRGFMDADGDIDPQVLPIYLAQIRSGRADIIYGSKRHPDSDVVYPLLRRWYSFVFRWFVHRLVYLDIVDTQTGIKFIRDDALIEILPRCFETGYAFDVELFVVAHLLGYSRCEEAPVMIGERVATTIDVRAIVQIIVDTLTIARRVRTGAYGA
jgi:glycosyltransferase involved in cell wall biosynthesis